MTACWTKTENKLKRLNKTAVKKNRNSLCYSIKYTPCNYRSTRLLNVWYIKYILWSSLCGKFENIRKFLVEVRPIVKVHKMFRFCPECFLRVQLKSCILWVYNGKCLFFFNMKWSKINERKTNTQATQVQLAVSIFLAIFFLQTSKHHTNFTFTFVLTQQNFDSFEIEW